MILLDEIPTPGQLIMPALTLAINLSFFLLLKLSQSNKKSFSKGGKKNLPELWDGFIYILWDGFSCGSDGKVSAYNAGDPGSIPGLGISSEEGNGNPLPYCCLENPMDGGVW